MSHDCSFLADIPLADDQVSFETETLAAHAADFGMEERDRSSRPDAVAYPERTADVAAVLSAATDRGVPVTPYAAGTGLEGGAMPIRGGISMDLTRMDAIADYRPRDLQIDVEPGVIGSAVDEHVAPDGLFFPPLPTSGDISTIGGLIATDASGMQTVKYGEVADWVLGLEVVLADGTVIETGTRAKKTSSGYNLTELLVGSEGTLGVVTRATLELAGRPDQVRGGRAIFGSLEDAASAIADAIQSGVDVARIELVDELSARIANAYLETDLPDAPMVFLEFHANHGIEAEIDFCRTIFADHDVVRFETGEDAREGDGSGSDGDATASGDGAADGSGRGIDDADAGMETDGIDAEMESLWRVREELGYAIPAYESELEPVHNGDVTVPIGAYPDVVREADRLATEHDLLIPCYGHAGDGNLHYTVLVDPDDPDHVELGERVYEEIVRRAIEAGGTATGEHGIGVSKRDYLEREHGTEAVEVMRSLKRAFDPTGTLNPGTILPDSVDSAE